MKPRSIAFLLLALMTCILIGAAVFAQGVGTTTWPMYRHDPQRTGKANANALDYARPVPIWIFPFPEKKVEPVNNDVLAADGSVTKESQDFTYTGAWTGADSTMSPNAFEGDFLWARGGTGATATWNFPLANQQSAKVAYYVYVWFPSRAYKDQPPHASNARYTVEVVKDGGGVVLARSFKVDQSSGGNWMVLTSTPFIVTTDQHIRVTLTTDGVSPNEIVVADGVVLKHDVGSVLSSPAFAPGGASGTDARQDDLVITCVTENRPLPTVTMEVPDTDEQGNNRYDQDGNIIFKTQTVQSGSVRVGRVYGVAAEDNPVSAAVDDRGMEQWRFPWSEQNWVAGGFSSSPVVGQYNGKEVAYCAARDGQIYVIDTRSGSILQAPDVIWQGPGYIDDDPDGSGWTDGNHGNSGYQGTGYKRIEAIEGGAGVTGSKATWDDFPISKAGSYAFYAWIPPSTPTEIQIPDATYTITIGADKHTATTDQSNGGEWAYLGKYDVEIADTVTVELSNVSKVASSGTRYVSADAIKVVPSQMGTFDWTSPVISPDGKRIYIGCSGGRMYCFEIGKQEPVWVYPDPADGKSGVGAIESSPTLYGADDKNAGMLYFGSASGHIYALDASDGDDRWVYPSDQADPSGAVKTLGQISSSIAVDGDNLYVGIGSSSMLPPGVTSMGMSGRVICLDRRSPDPDGPPTWVYPAMDKDAHGSFLWSSPLLYSRNGTDKTLAIGSTDGYLILLDPATGAPKLTDADGWPRHPDLIQEIHSSPAGVTVTNDGAPMAYVGCAGNSINGIHLRTGEKQWSYSLYGAVESSPAIAENRLYVGDMAGYTWAFSSRSSGGDGPDEDWNYDLSEDRLKPDEIIDDDDLGKNKVSRIEVDIFRRQEFESIKNGDSLPDGDLHKLARAEVDYNPTYEANHGHRLAYPYEWGETVYIIAWDCLDPNDKTKAAADDKYKWGGANYINETDSTVRLTIKSRGPGDEADQSTAFSMTEKGAFKDNKTGKIVFFAKYAYVLGTSSSSSTQAPGSRMTISVQELPATKNDSQNKGATAGDCVAPEHPVKDLTTEIPDPEDPDGERKIVIYDHAKFKPQRIAINNPLAMAYVDSENLQTAMYVGMTAAGTTDRGTGSPGSSVHENGTDYNERPWVRTGLVGHGTNSDERTILVCDRSLLSLTGNRLSKFRMERNDLHWTGGESQIWKTNGISTWLPWEIKPAPLQSGWNSNSSEDYPDIRSRQVGFTMAESRLDPTLENADLRPGGALDLPATSAPWPVGKNPVAEVVSVPKYQPANMTLPWPGNHTTRSQSGFTGRVYAFIDSNGDGRLNRPGSLGSSQLFQQSVTGSRAEAYREFYTQVHVPPDPRVEVVQKTFDIGAVPHGFGLTPSNSALPGIFYPILGHNVAVDYWNGNGITTTVPLDRTLDPHFKSFTAYNEGNINLRNIRIARKIKPATGPAYSLDLFSDTAEGSIYLNGGEYRPYGAHVPASHIVSALDPEFINTAAKTADPASLAPIAGLTTRTFHKPRVGESPTVLRLPDQPKRMYPSPTYLPSLPFFSVAVPMGTPVGTYSRSLTLYEDANVNGIFDAGESIGNPTMEAKVTVTENRLTDGYFPGTLAQTDRPLPNVSVGDVSPAAFLDANRSLHMFWSSSRFGPAHRPGTTAPAAGDPWYLYKSVLPYDGSQWNLGVPGTTPNDTQWWIPSATSFPTTATLPTFFNSSPGSVQLNSVKFTSPSIAQDPVNPASAWLFFGGEAMRYQAATAGKPEIKAHEYKTFYWPLDAQGNPTGNAFSSTHDWTMPKYGVKGAAARFGNKQTLWTFWYGGNNSQWRIYYNVSPLKTGQTVGDPTSWSNDGRLPLPRGLVSAAEPSIVPRSDIGTLDVVYSAYSQYHKNSDIYLTRYKPDFNDISNGSVEMDIVKMPVVTELLTRDPVSAIYSSRDVDWDTDEWKNPNTNVVEFENLVVRVYPDGLTGPSHVVSLLPYSRDSQTHAMIFTYSDPNDPVQVTLKRLFRTIIIDPEAGTVKFLRDPGPKAVVEVTYKPRAYRLTTDGAADSSPCALFDNGPNTRALVSPNNFWFPSGSSAPAATVDRLWVLWRRPSTVMKGTSIYYKSFRYTIQLDKKAQIVKDAGGELTFSAAFTGGPAEPAGPVEIDWAKNRLYFTAVDDGKPFVIRYPTAAGSDSVPKVYTVRLTEELDAQGNAFGNLTSEVSNEGQVCAIRDPDPYFSKLWVFWTSTRAGNTDVYYEAICPRFYAREFK